MPDSNHTLVPTLHDFTYDVYFFGSNLGLSQALEFDMNQFFGGMGFIWGHECRIAGGNEWDVWDNQSAHWTPTGIPCYPNNNAWNHLTIKVQRTSNNELLVSVHYSQRRDSQFELDLWPWLSTWQLVWRNHQLSAGWK